MERVRECVEMHNSWILTLARHIAGAGGLGSVHELNRELPECGNPTLLYYSIHKGCASPIPCLWQHPPSG